MDDEPKGQGSAQGDVASLARWRETTRARAVAASPEPANGDRLAPAVALLLLLRGKGREEILVRLREARSRRAMPAPVTPKRAEAAVAVMSGEVELLFASS